MSVKERDFVQDNLGQQFLVLSAIKIGKTMVMDLVSVESGTTITIFSPPRRFEKVLQLRFGSSDHSNHVSTGYDTSELLKPFSILET